MNPSTSSLRRSGSNVLSFLLGRSDEAPRSSIALRGVVGAVFLVSGAVKLLYANQGALRFAKVGLPAAATLASFVSTVEIVSGALLVLGLFTRLAALPLVADMIVAIATTKVPFLFGPGPEPVAAMPKAGFWAFAYQARLDVAMLVACAYLVTVGAGAWSLDAVRRRLAAQRSARTTVAKIRAMA